MSRLLQLRVLCLCFLHERSACNTVLQSQPVQKLHGNERLIAVLADFVDRADVRVIQGGSVRGIADLAPCLREETSKPRTGRARCPQLCRQCPYRRHRASRQHGSARRSGRSKRCPAFAWLHLTKAASPRQRIASPDASGGGSSIVVGAASRAMAQTLPGDRSSSHGQCPTCS